MFYRASKKNKIILDASLFLALIGLNKRIRECDFMFVDLKSLFCLNIWLQLVI